MIKKVKQIETIEIRGLDKKIIKRNTKADTFSGFLLGSIKKSRNESNWETAFFLEALYKKYKEYSPEKLNKIEIIEGWKGKSGLEIYNGFDNDFIIVTHQKNKEGEVQKITKSVKKEDVNRILNIIKNLEINQKVKCYYFAEPLGFKDWKELWKERKKYFTLYYYPIKIIEALNLIKYSGRGEITRLI